jgi:hypothetical protein
MRDRTAKFLSVTSLTFSLLFLCLPVRASLEPAGHVILTDGPFIAIQTNASARSLSRGSEFYQGDRLWTGPRTRAQIRFSDGAIMTLRPDTEFSVDEYQFDEKNAENNTSFFTLIKGGFRTLTGLISKLRPDGYRVKTAYAIVGVRGTNYEVVDQSALYVAAWEGTISVTNNKSEVLLGFGQDFNYATITSVNSAPKGTVEIPPPLQQTPDPGLQQAMVDPTETRLATSVTNPIADILPPALTDAELASLNQMGFAAVEGTGSVINSPFGGLANDVASGVNPIIFDDVNQVVLRQGSAPGNVTDTNTTLAGFPVSWGQWNATTTTPAIVQPDFLNGTVTQDVTNTTFWITAAATPVASLPTGTVSYTNVSGVPNGSGDGGSVNFVSLDATVNFAGGPNSFSGNLGVQNGFAPTDTWSADFSGAVSNASVSATVTTSTYQKGTLPVVTDRVTGGINGTITGPAGEGIAAAFDLRCADCVTSNVTNYVQGTVFATQ